MIQASSISTKTTLRAPFDRKPKGTKLLLVGVLFCVGAWNVRSMSSSLLEAPPQKMEASQQETYNPARICTQNPYRNALQTSLEQAGSNMDAWLEQLDEHQEKTSNATVMQRHNHDRFFPFEPHSPCQSTTCVGGTCRRDTSKIVCGLQDMIAQEDNDGSPCIVYSIGGNNHWEFELDVLQKTSCEVHTFDCTGELSRFTQPNNTRLHFHHVCLGTEHEDAPAECVGKEKCGETWTLLEMQQRLQHKNIDLFKIDIEGWEWPLLESWPLLEDQFASKSISLPMQILVEIHYQTQFAALRPKGVGPRRDFKFAADMVKMQTRLTQMGYAVGVRDDNRACRHCTELTLVRVRCPATGVYQETAVVA